MDRNVQNVKKMNQYSTVCKSIQEIEDIPPSDDSDYQIDSFTIIGEDKERTWKVTLDINGTKTPFKIDTGADITVISPATYKKLKSPKLSQSSLNLSSPGGNLNTFRGIHGSDNIQRTEIFFQNSGS